MKKEEQKIKPLLSLKQLVANYPERFPVYYRNMDEDAITHTPEIADFFEGYTTCSAYKSKGYFLFLHHFPISKPQL
ncbi:MAG TPA: hypothetical protein VFF27_05895 [Bacteroidia bacterium]|jgi:hypothetical protein|nr:hypothetical protein [Bacteroidia bacterium]